MYIRRRLIIYFFLLFYCDIFPNMHILPQKNRFNTKKYIF